MNKYRISLLLSISLSCFVFYNVLGQNKVVFIILDGIPADVLETVNTPTLDQIAGQGGYTRAITGGEIGEVTESPTVSAVGYNNILTGTWANKHNVWGNSIKNPNYEYWNIFRMASSDTMLTTAIYSTWLDNRTKLLGEGLEEAGNIILDYSFDGFELDTARFPHDSERKYIFEIDELVSIEAARHISDSGPDLAWIYLEFTDDMGHKFGDSREMANAVTLADQQVGRIWKAINFRNARFKENYLIIVTTDHGRDSETGKNHGGQSVRERTIWVVTNSSELNGSFNNKTSHVDIVPSILKHLKLDVPQQVLDNLDGVSFIGN